MPRKKKKRTSVSELGTSLLGCAAILGIVALVFLGFFFLFAEDETLKSTMAWLPWTILPTVYVSLALLIMSIWRPARLFTGILMLITAVLSFFSLLILCGIAMSLEFGRFLAVAFGIASYGVGWLVVVIIGTIFAQKWGLLIYISIWLGIDILAAGLGALMIYLGYGWVKDEGIKWLEEIIEA